MVAGGAGSSEASPAAPAGGRFHYEVHGAILHSDSPFPALLPRSLGDAVSADVSLSFVSGQQADASILAERCAWSNVVWKREGRVAARFGRLQDDWAILFPNLALFLISPDGRQAQAFPFSEAPRDATLRLFLNQALPLALSLRPNRLALHAAAVYLPESGGALAFAGHSGAGKSTLAAALGRLGFPILSDDGLLIERQGESFLVAPSYPAIRLRSDMAEALFPDASWTKIAGAGYEGDAALPFWRDKAPLRAICLLAPADGTASAGETTFEPVSPRDAFLELRAGVFRLNSGPEKLREEFETLSALAESLPCFRRRMPRGEEAHPARTAEAVARKFGASSY